MNRRDHPVSDKDGVAILVQKKEGHQFITSHGVMEGQQTSGLASGGSM